MNLKLVQHDKPELKHCEMQCDHILNEKLEKYELAKIALNTHSVCCFIGSAGSGKTSLVYSLFQSKELLRKVFHRIILFQPKCSRDSMKDQLFDCLPEEQKYEELTKENLIAVENEIKADEKKINSCIIIDDMSVYMKDYDNEKQLRYLVNNRRHLRLSIYILTQTYLSIPPQIRIKLTSLFLFRTTKKELFLVFDELCEKVHKDYILALSDYIYQERFDFLMLHAPSQRYFRNWDEVILLNDEDLEIDIEK